MDFTPREIDDERARRYVRRRLLGRQTASASVLADGSARRGGAPVHGPLRPACRTAARSATSTRWRAGSRPACAREASARRRGRVPAPELAGGGGDLLRDRVPRRGRRADRALLRAEGGRLHPAHDAREGARHRRPLRRTRTSSPTSTRMRDTLPDLEWVAVVGDDGRRRRRPRVRPISSPTSRSTRSPPVDPRAPALVAYTSGTTTDPEGRRALAPHDRRRDPPTRRRCSPTRARGGPPSPPSITGAPVGHGIGMLAALLMPGARPQRRSTSSTCGIRARAAGDARRRLFGRPGLDVLPHEPARPSRLRSRAPRPLMPVIGLGGSAVPAAVGERARATRHRRSRAASAAPSTRRSPVASATSPRDKRLQHRRRAAARRRDAPRRRRRQRRRASGEPGEIWSRGPDCFVGYTDPGVDRRPRSRPTAGS